MHTFSYDARDCALRQSTRASILNRGEYSNCKIFYFKPLATNLTLVSQPSMSTFGKTFDLLVLSSGGNFGRDVGRPLRFDVPCDTLIGAIGLQSSKHE